MSIANSWLTMLSTPAPVVAAPKKSAPKSTVRTDKGREILAEMYLKIIPSSKDVIQRLVAEAGMTARAARSFHENWRNKQMLPR